MWKKVTRFSCFSWSVFTDKSEEFFYFGDERELFFLTLQSLRVAAGP